MRDGSSSARGRFSTEVLPQWRDRHFGPGACWPPWRRTNFVLSIRRRDVKYENSVLHISFMVHIPYYATRLLRRLGMKADYLAMEESTKIWDKADYVFVPRGVPAVQVWQEFLFFWRVVAQLRSDPLPFRHAPDQPGLGVSDLETHGTEDRDPFPRLRGPRSPTQHEAAPRREYLRKLRLSREHLHGSGAAETEKARPAVRRLDPGHHTRHERFPSRRRLLSLLPSRYSTGGLPHRRKEVA